MIPRTLLENESTDNVFSDGSKNKKVGTFKEGELDL
jgi:hypothetical protein